MKIANKASSKPNASSEGVKDPSDLPLKPVHAIDWAKTHPNSDWVLQAARHSLGLEDVQSLPKGKDAVLRAALTNYNKEQLVIAIVSAMGGNLPSEIPSSKAAALTTLIDVIYKNRQHDEASLSAFASSSPATDANAGDMTPVGSVVTLSPTKRRTTTSSSTDRCVQHYQLFGLMFLFFRSDIQTLSYKNCPLAGLFLSLSPIHFPSSPLNHSPPSIHPPLDTLHHAINYIISSMYLTYPYPQA